MTDNTKLGRPTRAGAVADERITIRATPQELERWRSCAGDQPIGAWLRACANRAAARPSRAKGDS